MYFRRIAEIRGFGIPTFGCLVKKTAALFAGVNDVLLFYGIGDSEKLS